jgi:hypothetical protein
LQLRRAFAPEAEDIFRQAFEHIALRSGLKFHDGRRWWSVAGCALEGGDGVAAAIRFTWERQRLRVQPAGPMPMIQRFSQQPVQKAFRVQLFRRVARRLVVGIHDGPL